jgi:hypothetical protein
MHAWRDHEQPISHAPPPHSPSSAQSARKAGLRAPFDDQYLWGLIWLHRSQLLLGCLCLMLCTASNLAAPVLSGMLMETLVQKKPVEEYARVRTRQAAC